MATERFTVFDENGDEVALPTKFALCPRCRGTGQHDHPAFSNGITGEEWARDWDEDERDAYVAGAYDVVCSVCAGQRVVAQPDRAKLTADQRRWLRAQERDLAQLRADERSERFMMGDC